MSIRLQVRFDDPGFFVNDPRITVRVDGQLIHDGSFRGGFVASAPIETTQPIIETTIEIGPLSRSKRIAVQLEVPRGEQGEVVWEARLKYSRFWGNFSSRVDIRRVQ